METYEEPFVQEEAVTDKPHMCYAISSAVQYGTWLYRTERHFTLQQGQSVCHVQ